MVLIFRWKKKEKLSVFTFPAGIHRMLFTLYFLVLYQLRFIMPQKIINHTMVNAYIEKKEQTERSESMRHFIS